MKQYNVRFLKAGLSEFEVPDGTPMEDVIKLAKEHLDQLSDQDLCMAMSDCVPSGANPTRFDADSFQVEAIEDPTSDYEYMYTTNLWEVYINY